jgi:hypothetical protein
VVAKFESTKLLQVCSIYNKESDWWRSTQTVM